MDHDDYCRSAGGEGTSEGENCDEMGMLALQLSYEPDSMLRVDGQLDDMNSVNQNPTGAAKSGSADKKETGKTCFFCNKNYSNQYSLNRHLVHQHKLAVTPSTRLLQCPVGTCDCFFKHMNMLRTHIRTVHRIKLSAPVMLKFPNMNAFTEWKTNEQKLTHTKFVRPHGKYKRQDGVQVHHFYCHRSGYYTSEGRGLRRLKAQGSCKMGSVCPAVVTARQDNDGTVVVEYHNTHVGHFTDLEELYLSRDERAVVNRLVTEGSSFASVLDAVRDGLFGEVTYLTERSRSGVNEAKRVFELLAGRVTGGETDEEQAVRLLVQELEGLGEKNPIILHRLASSHNDDFILAFMSAQQTETLQRLGPGGIVCIDDNTDAITSPDASNHPNEHRLVSISVLATADNDDSCSTVGRPIPCAFAITNRLDEPTMIDFFNAVRHQSGQIRPRILLLHDSPHLNAWSTSMGDRGNDPLVLLTTWHTDAIWRRHLTKVTGKSYQKAAAYKALRVILKQPDRKKLSLLLAALQRHLHDSWYARSFSAYLKSAWLKRVESWAICYRDNATLRADLELETFHLTLLNSFPSEDLRRADAARVLLLQYGRGTTDPSSVARHHNAVNVMAVTASIVDGEADDPLVRRRTRWTVRDASGENMVERTLNDDGAPAADVCSNCCQFVCSTCGLCVHALICTCAANMVGGNFCAHLHFVGKLLKNDSTSFSEEANGTVVDDCSVVQLVEETATALVVDEQQFKLTAKTGIDEQQPYFIVTQEARSLDVAASAVFVDEHQLEVDGGSGSSEQPYVIVTQAELTPELIDRITAATFGCSGIVCDGNEAEQVQIEETSKENLVVDARCCEELVDQIAANARRLVAGSRDIGDVSLLTTLNDELKKLVDFWVKTE